MVKFTKMVVLASLLLPFCIGCGTQADTSAASTGVDDSVIQSEEQMQSMEADYEAQMQSQ